MQTNIKIILSLAALVLATSVSAQRDKSYILKHTNVEKLEQMAIEFSREYQIEHGAAIKKALEMGWDTMNLERLDERGEPVYLKTTNNEAAGITKTTDLRANLGVEGQNMVIGEWDGDGVRTTHQDFSSRATNMDGSTFNSHGTHVGGTLIGNPPSGTSDDSKGMAPQASLQSYDWSNDIAEMTTAAAGGLLLSNHSYGAIAGWDYEGPNNCFFGGSKWTWYGGSAQFVANGDDDKFGQYSGKTEDIDEICWNASFYLPVCSAGNDFNNHPNDGFTCDDDVRNGTGGTYVKYDPSVHPPGDDDQISSISTWHNAKNIMTVGNLKDNLDINESSSRGQTDDGRIKPDICGNGTTLYSADSGSDSDYGYKTGTSMASPNVAGSLLLLQQAYEEHNGNIGRYMKSATLKALAINTATDLGNNGPDYTYGWGLLNAEKGGDIIGTDAWSNGSSKAVIIEDTIHSANQTWVYEVNFPDDPYRRTITLAYTDPAASELVNDLDLKVIRVAGSDDRHPWVLNPNDRFAPATTGDNDIDNVEQVRFSSFFYGRYEIRITVEGSLLNNDPQPFSLIIYGLDPNCHANIQHKTIEPLTGTYTAQEKITSEATILPGREVTYQTDGRVVLKPGFKATAQNGAGAGFFKTAAGTCN